MVGGDVGELPEAPRVVYSGLHSTNDRCVKEPDVFIVLCCEAALFHCDYLQIVISCQVLVILVHSTLLSRCRGY
jgi:hypothetical protein